MTALIPAAREDGYMGRIGELVLRGDIDHARDIAADWALIRDEYPTRAEWNASIFA